MKHGLIVEKIAKDRKLRHVFLFNDIIVAAKQKIVNRFVIGRFSVLLRVQVNWVSRLELGKILPFCSTC